MKLVIMFNYLLEPYKRFKVFVVVFLMFSITMKW